MSDPQTNLEIEDVLSSIRRLVSQEATLPYRRLMADSEPQPVQDAPEEAEAPVPVAAECLVLTPALRIAVPEARVQDAPRQTPSQPTAAATDLGAELSRLEDTIAELEAAVADSGDEFEPEEGESLEFGEDEGFEPLPESFEDMVADAQEVPGPDATGSPRAEDPEYAGFEAPGPDGAEEAPDAGFVHTASPAPHVEAPVSGPSRLHLAQPDARVSRPVIHRATPVAAPPADTGSRDLAGLDEAALEALVADIIRKELQGRLGERITRSVRKLVRQEINRALTSQDFD
ncbi:MAG: hypothetical protein R3D53_10365 [Paracoccaceae bacterium]